MSRLVPTGAETQKYLTALESTHHRLATCTNKIPEARLSRAAGDQVWSALEILVHLRGCADLWTYSIYAMLTESNPTLALLDERRWAKTAGDGWLKFRKSLKAFTLQREELLSVLYGLSEAQWQRTADIGGRPHSVFSQARRLALHEAEHCGQIEAQFPPPRPSR